MTRCIQGWVGKIGEHIPYSVHRKPNASRVLTNLIPMRIQIYDVEDIEGFVNEMVLIAKIRCDGQAERDEIVCEGIVLLLNMAKNFKPQMEGYDKPGRFSGYCAAFLPRKISNAWYKMHPEHVQEQVELGDGRKVKRYRHGSRPDSIHQYLGAGNNDDGRGSTGGQLGSERTRTVGDFVHTG